MENKNSFIYKRGRCKNKTIISSKMRRSMMEIQCQVKSLWNKRTSAKQDINKRRKIVMIALKISMKIFARMSKMSNSNVLQSSLNTMKMSDQLWRIECSTINPSIQITKLFLIFQSIRQSIEMRTSFTFLSSSSFYVIFHHFFNIIFPELIWFLKLLIYWIDNKLWNVDMYNVHNSSISWSVDN